MGNTLQRNVIGRTYSCVCPSDHASLKPKTSKQQLAAADGLEACYPALRGGHQPPWTAKGWDLPTGEENTTGHTVAGTAQYAITLP